MRAADLDLASQGARRNGLRYTQPHGTNTLFVNGRFLRLTLDAYVGRGSRALQMFNGERTSAPAFDVSFKS